MAAASPRRSAPRSTPAESSRTDRQGSSRLRPRLLLLPAARLEEFFGRERCGRQAAHRIAEAAGYSREDLCVVVVRRRFDDRLRTLAWIVRLEDPRADEDAVRAELHAERRIRRCRDSAGGEGDNWQSAVLRHPAHELDGSLEVL